MSRPFRRPLCSLPNVSALRARHVTPLLLSVFVVASAHAEFLHFEIAFQDTGCVTCLESLQGRLERVRGVSQVTVEQGVARLSLDPGNRVRLNPLLARISQDGTKITSVDTKVRGLVARATLTVSGQDQTLRLKSQTAVASGDQTLEGRIELGDEPTLAVAAVR